jgi:Fic family protein
MGWDPLTPYDGLPLLPPSGDLEPKTVLKSAIEARAALAALDQAARLLPNPAVLAYTMPLLEAQASSEIENIVTTADALFKYAQTDHEAVDPATKEALSYRSALFEGVRAIETRPLTASTAERVCTRIKSREMGIRKLAGTRIANPSTGEVIYSPPEGADLIRHKLANWESFIHASDGLDPLVRMAVAHYQFEAIHPFHDGNGRTGRIVNILMLIEAALIAEPILYISRFINSHKNDYYRLLSEVTSDGAWEPWVLYMLEAVRQTADSTAAKVRAIRILQEEIHDKARAASNGGRNADFLAVLFEQPYSRIQIVMSRCGVSRPTATSWLNDLARAGILTAHKFGRDRVFVNERFLDVLLTNDLDEPAPAVASAQM